MKPLLFTLSLILLSSTVYGSSSSAAVSSNSLQSKPEPYVPLKDDIFIDGETQNEALLADSPNGGDFSDLDDGASGMGPDDEDSLVTSGDGSGGGTDVPVHHKQQRKYNARPVVPPKPEPTPKSAEPEQKWSTSTKSWAIQTTQPTSPSTTFPHPDVNRIPEGPANNLPKSRDGGDDNRQSNDVTVLGQKSDQRASSFFAQPGILAAVIAGAIVGLLCAIILVMFIVYRMRKKDEGSYPLDEPKRSPTSNSYTRSTNKEFYA